MNKSTDMQRQIQINKRMNRWTDIQTNKGDRQTRDRNGHAEMDRLRWMTD